MEADVKRFTEFRSGVVAEELEAGEGRRRKRERGGDVGARVERGAETKEGFP